MDKLILVLCLIIATVKAQNVSDEQDVNPLHPSMAVVLVALLIMVCITFVIVGYTKFCYRHELQLDTDMMVQDPGGILSTRPRFSGVDRVMIESLPFFRFSSLKGSKEGLECSVCLSKFEETETLRLLPKCRHAFHMNCIDTWLENHSSCPLCRCKFDVGDLKNFSNTNSFRYPQPSVEESNSNLNQNLEFFIQREQSQGRSSRFNISNTLQKLSRGKRDEPLIGNDRKPMHNLKHRIIASDIMHKSRWSDVNSSDILSLSSEMLNVVSSQRFTTDQDLLAKDQITKIKEDMERKRLYESAASSCPHDSDIELDQRTMSKTLAGPAQKRSMSEITNVPRFSERSRISGSSAQGNIEKDDDVRRLWLPMARRTIQLFSGGETTSSEARKHAVNVRIPM